MANWAIVIGINEYWEEDKNLHGAINDALDVVRWLTDPSGGNVPPENLYLLTRPANPSSYSDGSPLPPSIIKKDAGSDDLNKTIAAINRERGGKGDRLFFYFSGHGLTNLEGFNDEQAIVMANFEDGNESAAITISSIAECFYGRPFEEQFFFIDACRNVLPWNWQFRVGDVSCVGTPSSTFIPTQYWLNATAPRLKAVETSSATGEGGAFTQILLKGLNGAGSAKTFVRGDFSFPYHVYFNQLAAYVEAEILKLKFLVSEKGQPPQYQRPYYDTKNNTNQHPGILRRFLANDPRISAVHLEIFVEPKPAWGSTTLIVTGDDANSIVVTPVDNAPVHLTQQTMPMPYTVKAIASGYTPGQPYWSCNLYDDTRIDVVLNASLPPIGIPTANYSEVFEPVPRIGNPRERITIDRSHVEYETDPYRESYSDRSDDVSVGVEEPVPIGSNEEDSMPQSSLTAYSEDPLAPLEITDTAGKLIASGQGRLTAVDLAPGFYRARLVTPEGRVSEKLVDLSTHRYDDPYTAVLGNSDQTVMLSGLNPSGSPIFEEAIEKTDFLTIEYDNTLHVAEYVGAVATPQLTTMLLMEGGIISEDFGWDLKTKHLGLRSFREATNDAPCGIRIIAAEEAENTTEADTYLAELRIAVSDQGDRSSFGEPGTFEASQDFKGVAQYIQSLEPGTYTLSLWLPGSDVPTNFSITALPNRINLFVLHRRPGNGIRIFGFSPSSDQEPDFNYLQDKLLYLRGSELLQRYYLTDRLSGPHALEQAKQTLQLWSQAVEAKHYDPLAVCLGGYTMLKIGKPEELKIVAENMSSFYGTISDSHILYAEYLRSENETSGRLERLYTTALDQGIPIFAEGFQRLGAAIDRFKIDHPLVDRIREISENRVRNNIWTSWTPTTEK